MPYEKICSLCGKKFIGTHPKSHICPDRHFRKCEICGTEFEVFKSYLNRKTCSSKCQKELRKRNAEKTSLEKYGVKNAGYTEESKRKIKQTNLKKYGVEHAFQSNTVKSSIKETNLKKYGVENPMQSESIKAKVKATNLARYGSECVLSKSSSLKALIDETNLRKYGTTDPGNRPEAIEKRKSTNLKRYGVEYPSQSEDILQKKKENHLKKYGVEYSAQRPEVKAKCKQTLQRRYGVSSTMLIPSVRDKINKVCENKYGVPWPCMTKQCIHSKGSIISKINKKFAEVLNDQGIQVEFEFSINSKNYDLKILNSNLLIEINPTYSHTTEPTFYGGYAKDYHLNKTKNAVDSGFRCINVWDWDDWEKIVQLIKPKTPVYARKCSIKLLNVDTTASFESKYHLQNFCKGQTVRLGLYRNDELVEIMTFGKPRYNKNFEWELLRLCSKSEYVVVGGAEKLFKYFVNNYNPSSIISYCDMSKFSGKVYGKLGFNLKYVTEPAKHWSYGKNHITDNLLRQRGYDQLFSTNYGKGTSNEELMLKHHWLPVYDCGQAVYVWKGTDA